VASTLSDLPLRAITGGYILHTGIELWSGSQAQAEGVHKSATTAYPVLATVPPTKFLKLLSASQIAVGAALLTPLVSNRLAGAALTGFAGGLVGMYLRTPEMHRPNSIWPTPKGIGVSKDSWLLAIGLSLALRRNNDVI
jgi:hypothetical protein